MKVASGKNTLADNIKEEYEATEAEAPSTPDIETIPEAELTLDDLEVLRSTKEKELPKLPATFTMNGAYIAKAGNITGISALQKAGKSGFQSHLAALAVNPIGNIEDCLPGLEVLPNNEKKAVILIDTEQSEEDQQSNTNSVLKLSRYSYTPDHCRFYNIRKLSLQKFRAVTERIIDLSAQHCNGVHSIFIDGGADFVNSVNDEEESNAAIHFFIQLSIKYNCPVFIIVHLNPGAAGGLRTKERGHFGSTLLRKCYAMLSIEKKDDISTVTCTLARKAANADTQPIHFKFSKDKGYHVSVEADTTLSDKDQKRFEAELSACKAMAKKILSPPAALSHTELKEKIMGITAQGLSTAKRKISFMIENAIISHGDDKKYRMETAS